MSKHLDHGNSSTCRVKAIGLGSVVVHILELYDNA